MGELPRRWGKPAIPIALRTDAGDARACQRARRMPSSPTATRPACPHCGEPIGTYEPVWWIAPHIGAERTSWLHVADLGAAGSLRHVACAEADGVDGG